ncbi:S-adenosyl-L-methionine-dependent methyltransferase [Pleomassaria siparia CBS 279.74]|uniref:S-adenosyl-L-methionine-dependent methyltransferase n=1 Tax=Pleomassaria siparia CBS 279.74 TaxID=1314801 RepID=A0A6G1KIG5_9PLEO|nr:S-adenosyl-L-methionine-dependent methyltransferase [Pleomassaria siparia CBS 279.74]
MATTKTATYTQGYHPTVTAAHVLRTAESHGAMVLPYLSPTFKVLDVGCGPGTITTGFAKYVPEGSVIGIDLTEDVLSQAREHLLKQKSPPNNVTFEIGNVVDGLKYEDDAFDVVFTSQVLIHIPDPVTALKEMKRVLKPGGVVCAREADWPFRFYPYTRGMQLFNKYLNCLIHARKIPPSHPQPDNAPFPEGTRTGSLVHVWGREAGFDPEKMAKSAKADVYATEEERKSWGEPMLGRMKEGGTGDGFRKRGATKEEVEEIIQALKDWTADVDGWLGVISVEVVLRK